MSSNVIYWVGAAHIAFYAGLGTTRLFVATFNRVAKDLNLSRKLLLAYWLYLKREQGVPRELRRLIVAARCVAWGDGDEAELRELQAASEAFATTVPWADEPTSADRAHHADCGR